MAHKVGVVSAERVEDKCLVRLWDFCLKEAPFICQIHLRRDGARVQARRLGVQLQVDRLVWLDADDELIARDILEDALCDFLELDADLHLALVEGCACVNSTYQLSMRQK